MKRLIAEFMSLFYVIKSPVIRHLLRSIIARLEGGQAFSTTLRKLMKKYHGYEIGIGTYGPCFNPEQTWTGYGNLIVGKYTSIANGVCFYSRNHPYWHPSTSPLFYNSSFQKKVLRHDSVPYGKLTIGNDVWIGQYAVVLPSCKSIGDGAVIGAGSIVTKDVPPYAIVAGNPAKILKYRFNKQTIERIQQIRWWDKDVKWLKENVNSFQDTNSLFALLDGSKEKSN